jgi:hypothetical protein
MKITIDLSEVEAAALKKMEESFNGLSTPTACARYCLHVGFFDFNKKVSLGLSEDQWEDLGFPKSSPRRKGEKI